jgi:Domain of unknown function (DUF4350)
MILIAVAFLLAGTLVAWFFRTHERVEVDVETGFRGQARTNPYLAAERLFQRLGTRARTVQAGLPIPPPGHTLFLLRRERSVSESELEKILAWVAAGGRLVVAQTGAPLIDPLMRHFRITARVPDLPVEDAPVADSDDEAAAQDEPADEVIDLALLPGGGHARVAVPRTVPRLRADDVRAPFAQAGSAAGSFFLLYQQEQGEILFLADASFLRNDRIGRHDHAELAWHLATGGGATLPAGVEIVFRDEVPTLSRLLARHAWAALVSGALLLAAWLWASGSRFGPPVPDPAPERRSLLEHITAAGEFLWRTGRSAELLDGARLALQQRIERRQPAWARLPQRDLARRLATLSGLPPARVDEALRGRSAADPAELLSLIQLLESLRRSL